MPADMPYDKWFRCPRCGDEGEVKLVLYGDGEIRLEFYCYSNKHKPYKRKTKREYSVNHTKSLLSNDKDKINKGLIECTKCPNCGSRNTDGTLENGRDSFELEVKTVLDIEPEDEKRDIGFRYNILTLWCYDCENTFNYTQALTKQDKVQYKSDIEERISKTSKYPPKYIEC